MNQDIKDLSNNIIDGNETDILENKHLHNDSDYQAEEVEDSYLKLREAPNLCERVLPVSEEPEKSLGNHNVEQKSLGRRYITIRNLPLAANTTKFRKEISKVCAPVSMGVVRINNMDYTLLHLQYKKKDDIDHIYRCMKQNEYILH